MDPCFPQVVGISVPPQILRVLAFQSPNHESIMKAPWNVGLCSQSRSPELGIQQSQVFHSFPALFLFFPPVSWGGGGARVPWSHGSGTSPRSMRSALFSRCVQSDTVLFPVAFSGLVVLIIFSYYMWFQEEASVTPHMLPSLISPCNYYLIPCPIFLQDCECLELTSMLYIFPDLNPKIEFNWEW